MPRHSPARIQPPAADAHALSGCRSAWRRPDTIVGQRREVPHQALAHSHRKLVVDPAVPGVPHPGVAILGRDEDVCRDRRHARSTGCATDRFRKPAQASRRWAESRGLTQTVSATEARQPAILDRALGPVRRCRVEPGNASRAVHRRPAIRALSVHPSLTERLARCSLPKTRPCSRCPTPARPSGTWRIRRGSSKPSCCVPMCRATASSTPAYEYLFNSYYEAVGPRHPRPQRGMITRPGVEEIRPIAGTSPTRPPG